MKTLKQKSSQTIIILILIILSSLLRLTFLSTIEFKTDEAVALFLASRPIFHHPFPPGGTVSSYGILNPPLFLYFLFPLIAISLNPQVISFFIGLINVVAIAFFYLFVRKYYGKMTAFFSAFLIALSPWMIIYSRKIWPQDFIFPLTVLLLFSLHKIYFEKKTLYWFFYTISTLFLLQLHQALVFFLLPLNILFIMKKPKLKIKYLMFSLIVGILPLIPYFIFDITHGWKNLSFILNAGKRASDVRHLDVFLRPFQIINQGNFRVLLGDDMFYFAQKYPVIYKLKPIFYLEYVLLFLGAVIYYLKHRNLRFLLYSSLLLPIIYFIFKVTSDMHYFIILVPMMFIYIGEFFTYFLKKKKLLRYTSISFFSLLIILSFAYNLSFFNFLKEKKSVVGDYGTIFEVSDNNAKKHLKSLKSYPDYQEILINEYIPYNYMHGNIMLASMIYDFNKTKEKLSYLDNQFIENPLDARVRNELLAYYTATTPTSEILSILRKKAQTMPSYYSIYTEAYNDYLLENMRKLYENRFYGFAFEYPEHWVLKEKQGKIFLSGDSLNFEFTKIPYSCKELIGCVSLLARNGEKIWKNKTIDLLTQRLDEKTCFEKNNQWCGTLYGPFISNEMSFVFSVELEKPKSGVKLIKNNKEEAQGVINIVLSSLRKTE